MAARPSQRLQALTATLSDEDWFSLGALAAEERLGATALAAIAKAAGRSCEAPRIAAFIERGVASGLLVSSGEVRSVGVRVAGLHEPGWAVANGLRQLTLRAAQARGSLRDSTRASAAVLGQRSQGAFCQRLQAGTLQLQPESGRAPARELESSLRESVCEAFDGAWFERTWGAKKWAMTTRVLRHALPGLEACTELYLWAVSHVDDEVLASTPGLPEAIVQHSLFRQKWEQAARFAERLSAADRFAYLAASAAMRGDVADGQRLLDRSLTFASRRSPQAGALTPVLALLLLARETDAAVAAARGWLGARALPAELKGVGRALRTLLRRRIEPEGQLKRIDAYQQAPDTTAWELLILGATVRAFVEAPVARAAWARLLLHRAQEWSTRDYDWPALQARSLARSLDGEFFEETVPQDVAVATLGAPPLLAELVVPPAPWQRALRALDELTLTDLEPATPLRLEWFLNMVDGSLLRPGLQEFHTGEGWSAARRVSLDEAYEHRATLPPEDQKVLECSFVDAEGVRHLLPEAHEALIGHGRVLNGARGDAPVDVVRGMCRVETAHDGDFLKIAVTPRGLAPGVNLRVTSESQLMVVRVTPALEAVLRALPDELRVPRAHAERALTSLAKLGDLFSPETRAARTVQADATPCLRIVPAAGAWLVEAGVQPFGAGGRFFGVATGARELRGQVQGEMLRANRDFEEEARRLHELITGCPCLAEAVSSDDVARAPGESKDTWSFSADALLTLLAEIRDSGLACHFVWPESQPIGLRGTVTGGSLRGNLRSQKGWYLVSGSVQLDEVTDLSLAELVSLPTVARGRFVRLPTGDFLELEERVRRIVAALSRGGTARAGGRLRLHESSIHTLRELEDGQEFTFDEETRQRLARFDEQVAADFEPPPTLNAELRSYQREGFRWLCCLGELGLGACLADDMGLGKTIQILAFLLTRPPDAPILIVAPTSVCTNWTREIARFAPTLSAVEYVGGRRSELLERPQGRVIVCSYAVLHEDAARLAQVDWNTVVLDEAQFIKNPQSQRAQAAFSLRARHRIAATGTPVENHLGDLWSLFHFLQPELFGSWKSFNLSFVKPIERDHDRPTRQTLRAIVQPYVLRRLKSQVLTELPALTTVRHELTLSRDEALRYAVLRRQIHTRLRTVAGKRYNKLEVLAEITRLRRFCCHPKLVFPDSPSESTKIDAFLALASELRENGHRTLVFSQYVDFLALVRERLEELDIGYEYLDGSTPKARRQAAVDAFQSGSEPLFLISLKAGGLGLNLTAADYVIHLDPWWNPAVGAQATDRAHRIGQLRPVTVYQFVTRDTIEEDILELHETKRELADALLEGGERTAGLSAAELVAWIEGARSPGFSADSEQGTVTRGRVPSES